MAAPAKFLFDMDFSAPDKARERPPRLPEIAQKIAAAEARAYRDGFDAAQREAKAESDRRTALALEEIGIGIQGIAARFAGIETRMETEAVDVAVAVARKLCSELIAAEPLGEITGAGQRLFLASGLDAASGGPDQRSRSTRPRASGSSGWPSKAASRAGWSSWPSRKSTTGDCRIEWADGGVVLERAAIEAKINELVGRYMASRNQAGTAAMRIEP